jgi:two-component system response regulator YcbB
MAFSFYIVDDDRSVRKILMQIITTHFEGSEIHQSDDPWFSVQDILRQRPDIVVLDLLMEGMDGIEVAQILNKNSFPGQIIMLSEVGTKEIIGQAYDAGVHHYISKPINVTEVVNILNRTIELQQLKSYVRLMGAPGATKSSMTGEKSEGLKRPEFQSILKDIGIVGEPGTEELMFALTYLMPEKQDFSLNQLYQWLKDHFPPYVNEPISLKGIEQRLRRLVQLAMENIANIGVEDFSNYKFERYSTTLFSFKAVRQEMDFARSKGEVRGKVDVKRFIEGILVLLE